VSTASGVKGIFLYGGQTPGEATGAEVQAGSEGETVHAKLLSGKSGVAEVMLEFE
jgi:hypothetical protein